MTGALDVLVVDDNALDRELVRRLLAAGPSVREAATATDARAALAEALPSIVLLDNRLPDADGVDVLPLFAERHIPVVMLTEVEAPEVIVVAMQRGAADYLVKGALTRDSLDRAIANAIEKTALRQQVDAQHRALAEQAEALEVRNREIRALATALTLAEQAERHRIAAFLHDDVQQLLFGARLQLQVIPGADAARQAELVERASAILEKAIFSTRNLVAELTPPAPDEDLAVALQWIADHMGRLYHVAVEIEAEAPVRVPSRDLRVLLVQIVRELVFNAIKHAGVDRVHVRLAAGATHLTITVTDGGCGFDLAEVQQRPTRGFGLNSVRERLELVGGGCEIASCPGQGTCVTITAPV